MGLEAKGNSWVLPPAARPLWCRAPATVQSALGAKSHQESPPLRRHGTEASLLVGCHGYVVRVWNSSFRALGRGLLNWGWAGYLFSGFLVGFFKGIYGLVSCFAAGVLFLFCFCRSASEKQSVLEGLRGPGRTSEKHSDFCWRERRRRRRSLPQKD